MCIYSGGGGVYVHFARAWISSPKIFGTFGWISLKLIKTEVKAKTIKRNYGTVHIYAWLWEFYWGFSMKATVFNKRN